MDESEERIEELKSCHWLQEYWKPKGSDCYFEDGLTYDIQLVDDSYYDILPNGYNYDNITADKIAKIPDEEPTAIWLPRIDQHLEILKEKIWLTDMEQSGTYDWKVTVYKKKCKSFFGRTVEICLDQAVDYILEQEN